VDSEILSLEPRRVAWARRRETAAGPTLREVFDASYRRLVVQLYGVVGDIHEAEDLVQEAFVRATAAGERFSRAENHEAWLRTTAINLHRNRWRKLRNQAKIRQRPLQPTDLDGLDERVAVVAALRTLPQAHREVLALHYLADLPVADVAQTLGCPVGTVKSRLQRARNALAAALGPWEGRNDV
jgi:RNA polymerase sigma-70 factor, ECF subfamily